MTLVYSMDEIYEDTKERISNMQRAGQVPKAQDVGHYERACRESLRQRGWGKPVKLPDGREVFQMEVTQWAFEATRAIEQLYNEKKPGYRLENPFNRPEEPETSSKA